MAMRPQCNEYRLDVNKYPELGQNGSGRVELGNEKLNQKIIVSSATEFHVLHRIGASLKIKSYVDPQYERDADIFMQLRINTTDYFVDDWRGVSNRAFPFPFPEIDRYVRQNPKTKGPSDFCIYIIPGQSFGIVVVMGDECRLNRDEYFDVCLDYTLYDGADCAMVMSLLESGKTVCVENVDMMKLNSIGGCQHNRFYILCDEKYGEPSYVDACDMIHWHDSPSVNINNNEWHSDTHDKLELLCVDCHCKIPFTALTKSEYEAQFILDKKKDDDE